MDQWASSRTKLLSLKATTNHYKDYYMAACQQPNITEKKIKDYESVHDKLGWKTFDMYVKCRTLMWKVEFCATDLWKTTCSCPVFANEYACKHSMGVAVRLNYMDVPATSTVIPIGQKRKRGRPVTVGPALSYT